jgi:hypothetical protein
MPFTAPTRTGSWLSLTDLAGGKNVIRVARGFLEDDPNNKFKGQDSPRYIIHGTVDGEETMVGSLKGGSRDAFLEDAAAYLDKAPAGSYIDIGAEPVEGSRYIVLTVVDSVDAE